MPQPVFLVGPTSVGKSSIAIILAKDMNPALSGYEAILQDRKGGIHAEIVSCDSMQVYRGMDIGTAKPAKKEQGLIPHHMIDIVDLTQEYNAAKYAKDASKAIAEIQKRDRIPLVVGGTGLYVRALTDGLFIGPPADEGIRNRLERQDSLYEELKKVDPISANRIKPQDKRRIIRALEVYHITGEPISSFQTQWLKKTGVFLIGLNRNRKDLYNRIDKRVEEMFKDGFIDEVKRLTDHGLTQNKTARQALGYKEILGFLEGRCNLEETKHLIKKNTKHFARRQLTWFRKDDRVKWIWIQQDEEVGVIVEKIKGLLQEATS